MTDFREHITQWIDDLLDIEAGTYGDRPKDFDIALSHAIMALQTLHDKFPSRLAAAQELDNQLATLSPSADAEGAAEAGRYDMTLDEAYGIVAGDLAQAKNRYKVVPFTDDHTRKRRVLDTLRSVFVTDWIDAAEAENYARALNTVSAPPAAPSLLRPLSGDEDGGAK